MADSKEDVITSRSDFIQELLPFAQRTALLYHLSYLCLANFPKLEEELRKCSVETQLLFGSSEALLRECEATSKNLVFTVLPVLIVAVEANNNVLAIKCLEKARAWITEIINRVKEMVNRYENLIQSVASCTSDVILEKAETEQQTKETSLEIEAQEKVVSDLEVELKKNADELGQIEQKIQEKQQAMQSYLIDASNTNNGLTILAVLVPFVGIIVKSIYDAVTGPDVAAKTQALSNEISNLYTEKSSLRNKEWNIQVKLTDAQRKLASMKIEQGSIPSPVHLTEVQTCLTRIHQNLIQLLKFWESVCVMLEALKDKTFATENFLEEYDLKDIFLTSIRTAIQLWKSFGESCLKAVSIFCLQTKDAYKFLETSPSSLSPVEWKEQYDDVIVELNKISPDLFTPQAAAAISE
ncbi:hypothetical protein QQF64_023162 [Cirrhinus molitorella]|uniref:Uncharacterized protein n=1 Tax=Cirrhinus molitorella TaxID=172907 RepID=A0ABR3L6Q4_9TELE